MQVDDHAVVVENLGVIGVEHNSRGTLVLSYCNAMGRQIPSGQCYSAAGPGKTFLEGTQFNGFSPSAHTRGPGLRVEAGHRLWARALDMEGFLHTAENDNAQLWVMGTKFGESEADPF
eukprot:gene8348-8873_t